MASNPANGQGKANSQGKPRSKRTPGKGDNSDGDVARYADRLQQLEEEKLSISEDIKALKEEAKDHGIHVKALASVVKMRIRSNDMDWVAKQREYEEKLDAYRVSLGVLLDTPLGQAAASSEFSGANA